MLYQNTNKTFLIEEIILNDKDAIIQKKILKLYLIGRLTVEEHKEGFETYLNLFKEGNYTHAIFDYLKLEYDPPQSRAWFVSSYVPRYGRELKDRECYLAVIESSNLFQKMTTNLIANGVRKIYNNLHITLFSDIEKANEWLLSK